jgi:ParB family chromosome partitioning protein
MSSKQKRFLGSPLSTEIAETIRQGQEQAGEINVELIPVTRIDVDDENPRRTGFTPQDIDNPEVVIGDNGNLKQIWEGLLSLATSIKSVGVQQPIKVYRHRDRFRIAFGERRFLASLIAGKATIPAWILQDKPKYLRNIQYIENVQREDLTTWERLQNVQAIKGEYEAHGGGEMTITVLTEISGMSRSRASHYLSILNGPEDVKELIRTGALNNIEKGGYLSRIKEDYKRIKAMELTLEGKDLKAIEEIIEGDKAGKSEKFGMAKDLVQPIKMGRPRTKVNLGQTANTQIIRHIMTSITIEGLDLPSNDSSDWDNLESVSEYWKRFLTALEQEIQQKG